MFYDCSENLGGVGVVVWKCWCDVFPFYSFKRASRSHAKTGFFRPPKQSSHAGKTHFFTNVRVFVFSKTTFYLHGSSIFVIFYFFMFFCVFGATLKIAVLLAWELNSGEVDLQFCVFLWFSKKLKKQFFARVVFSRFFIIFGAFWEAFWLSFGVLLESPSSLWRAGALLLVVFLRFLCFWGSPWK